ncbi:calmodulin-binding protein 60 A-like isoform X2 [Andrographis paniculata]|uniref:calmodulin-binding protein 60 A-like isoform X2 n=1 Tax=Andrographis paniculata TaxID=175694 RepID=UPI0021E75217|nr:calmodulin-binding protein 60 A-like isoform X2 [Andrographis paniculata]XP_051123156.1 calmodulin-binding protein 60 A-like isoform X2 [Andrographis paniculata]
MEESRMFKGAKILQKIVDEEMNSAKERIRTTIKALEGFDSSNFNDLINFSLKVDEEFNTVKKRIQTRIAEIGKDMNRDSLVENLKLQFSNNISPTILTGEEIKGEGGVPMEVELIDLNTGKVVDAEPEASLSVEIFLLQGESSNVSEEFEEVIGDKEGNKSLLVGDLGIKLLRGVGVMKTVKLKHRAKKVNPPVFCLGARAVVDMIDKVGIKAAVTKPFTAKNYRRKYYEKHDIPSLSDEIYRLTNIRKGGPISRRLQANEIETVEDFLICFLKDPEGLRSIVAMGGNKWKDTLANARACQDQRMYCYADIQQKTANVFKIIGEDQELHLDGQYLSTNSEAEKARESLLASSYKHWKKEIKRFDNEDSLKEHLAHIQKSWDPPDSQIPDNYFSSYFDPGGEIYAHNYNLTLHENFITGTPQYSSFSPEVELWCSDQCFINSDRQPNSGEHTNARFVEFQDVRDRQPMNGWKLFSSVWKWSSVIKKKRSARCQGAYKTNVHHKLD